MIHERVKFGLERAKAQGKRLRRRPIEASKEQVCTASAPERCRMAAAFCDAAFGIDCDSGRQGVTGVGLVSFVSSRSARSLSNSLIDRDLSQIDEKQLI
jgi:hypothetical protein